MTEAKNFVNSIGAKERGYHMIKVSLIASSIRPNLYDSFFNSLEGTSCEYEVVFAGNTGSGQYKNLKYIKTKNIKPAQCYEVARRHASGEVVIWVADDCEFPDDVIGKAYSFYKETCSHKDVVCIQTQENYGRWQVCDITQHKFFAASAKAPKMAPLGMINREYSASLGGIDRRYICGQWDNDLMMRVYRDGGKLYHFSDACIKLDHLNKHDKEFGISAARPFGQGYKNDREILEGTYGKRGKLKYEEFPNFTIYDSGFEPYTFDNEKILVESESYNIKRLFND